LFVIKKAFLSLKKEKKKKKKKEKQFIIILGASKYIINYKGIWLRPLLRSETNSQSIYALQFFNIGALTNRLARHLNIESGPFFQAVATIIQIQTFNIKMHLYLKKRKRKKEKENASLLKSNAIVS
jgi:hypothetical protein